MKQLRQIVILAILLGSFSSLWSQITVNTAVTAQDLVDELVGGGITVSNPVLDCPTDGAGIIGGMSSLGFMDGIVLTSGGANNIPNVASGFSSVIAGGSGDPDLENLTTVTTCDACVLSFDFVPNDDMLTFNYIFASEEYPEYFCNSFNDVFAFFISGPNPGGGNYSGDNVAIIPGTNLPVTINNLGPGDCNGVDNSHLYVDNSADTDIIYDGKTVTLSVMVDVVIGQTYTFKLGIADAGDCSFDSGIFIESGSLSTMQVPPSFSKAFSPPTIPVNGTSTLTFTIDNSASTDDATGLDFTDNLPANVVVATVPNASTTCTGGTLTAVSGSGTISYTGGTVSAGASCTITVDVTSDTPGDYNNVSGDLTSSLGNSGNATAMLTVEGLDYGDAPDGPYPTLLANNGARHSIGGGFDLGGAATAEADGQANANASGDTDDGINFSSGTLETGSSEAIAVTASAGGFFNAWIDFNKDGDWNDANEQIYNDLAIPAGITYLNYSVPNTALGGTSFARFRFCSTAGDCNTVVGLASDGEVEDYQVTIVENLDISLVDIDGDGFDEIDDPCRCSDPLNVRNEATGDIILYHDFITIFGGAVNQVWRLNANLSGAILQMDGTPFPSGAAGQVLTDLGNGVYQLEFWHEPSVGFDAQFRRDSDGAIMTITNICPPASCILAIPTMSQWGLIIFGLFMLNLGLVFVFKQQLQVAGAANHSISYLPFDKAIFFKNFVLGLLVLALVFILSNVGFAYELMPFDIPGSIITAALVAYMIQLIKVNNVFDKKV